MKAFIAAVLVAITLGFGASAVLSGSQKLAYEKYATSGVRLSEPGHNLVGHSWNGAPTPEDYTDETKEKAKEAQADSKRS